MSNQRVEELVELRRIYSAARVYVYAHAHAAPRVEQVDAALRLAKLVGAFEERDEERTALELVVEELVEPVVEPVVEELVETRRLLAAALAQVVELRHLLGLHRDDDDEAERIREELDEQERDERALWRSRGER